MTQRLLRTVPATVLLTTALSWNLSALAQGTPSASDAGTPAPASTSPGATRLPAEGGMGGMGGNSRGLPADLTPAMPASAASAAPHGRPHGTPPRPQKP